MASVVVRAPVVILVAVTAAATIAVPVRAQDDPHRGREVFEQSCAMCHGQDASGMMGVHPSLRGAIERLSREGVDVTIRAGRNTTPPMPPFESQLTEEEIDDVVAYLDTLPVGPRNFGSGGDEEMMDGMMDGGMWSWLLWSVLFLLFVAAIEIGSVLLTRKLWSRGGGQPPARDAALDILKQRFARGEIDRDEFEERRRSLTGDS